MRRYVMILTIALATLAVGTGVAVVTHGGFGHTFQTADGGGM